MSHPLSQQWREQSKNTSDRFEADALFRCADELDAWAKTQPEAAGPIWVAALLAKLKEECESQHARAEAAETKLRTQGWQPIETAPKGEIVFVHDDGYIGKAMKLDDGRWWDVEVGRPETDANSCFDPAPTHWMPLPAPPETEK